MTANEEWLKSAAFPVNRDLTHAGVAQLVERNLAKVEVDGSNPFARSKHKWAPLVGPFVFGARYGDPGRGSIQRLDDHIL